MKHLRQRLRAPLTATTAAVAAAGLGLVAAIPSHAASAYTLLVRFEEGPAGQAATRFVNTGSESVSASVVTQNGGSAAWAKSPGSAGSNTGLRLPAFQRSTPPRAILQVLDSSGSDGLSPGTRAFGFGADFRINTKSQAKHTGDDGNNLVQRGLHYQSAQYKLQVDNRTPSCTIKGSSGSVTVRGPRIAAGKWHRLWCTLSGGRISLRLAPIAPSGAIGTSRYYERAASVGSVSFPSSVPFSAGGKLSAVGQIVSTESADQFNGSLDNVLLFYP